MLNCCACASYISVSGEAFVNKTGQYFSHVFGAEQSLLESFVLKRKLKGPCWLEISNPQMPKLLISYCQNELTVCNPKDIKVVTTNPPPPPPLVVVSLATKTVLNRKQRVNELIAIGMVVHRNMKADSATETAETEVQHYEAVRKVQGTAFPVDFLSSVKHQVSLSLDMR